ncbi:MAG: hypothetical protein WAP35_02425 [Solirubrobacterales bacterium]
MNALRSITAAAREDRRLRTHLALIALTGFTFLLALIGIEGSGRQLFALIAMTLVPGFAVLSRLKDVGPLMKLGVAAAISLTVFTLGTWVLIEVSLFELLMPFVIAVFSVSVWILWQPIAVAARRLRKQRFAEARANAFVPPQIDLSKWVAEHRSELLASLPIVIGLLLWLVSLPGIDTQKLDDYGLPAILPFSWKLGLGMIITGATLYAMSARPNRWLLGAYVVAAITVIYATVPLIADAPHYPASYKHIGVIRLFLQEGHLYPDVDIYNRWPGFFSMAAGFVRLGGIEDEIGYVGWSELFFALLQATLVAAIALRETRKAGVAGLAALIFVFVNWIGQGYFSPQALAFTLALAALAIALGQLSDSGNPIGRLATRVVDVVARTGQSRRHAKREAEWSQRTAVGLLLAIDAAIIVSHQLTPYALALQLGLLVVCGFIKPRWLLIPLGALPLMFLLPHLGWINDHFGVFTSLDPFNNAQVNDPIKVECAGCDFVGSRATMSSAFAWLGGLVSIIVLARRSESFRAPVFGLIMLGPFLFLAGQNYGGEAPLRVVMFSSPFSACLMAAAIGTFSPIWRRVLAVATTLFLAMCFAWAYYGGEAFHEISARDVTASEYFFKNGDKGDVLVAYAPPFPDLIGADYPDFAHLNGGGPVVLFDRPGEQAGRISGTRESVDFVVGQIQLWARDGYVVFSPNMTRFNAINKLATPAETAALQKAMVETGRFKLWYEDGPTKIYDFVK